MGQSKLIDPNWVVLVWVTTGIEDFFLSFRMRESAGHSRYEPFFNAMGMEMGCKGYLFAVKRSEYELLAAKAGEKKVDDMARDMGHKVIALVKEIGENIGQDKVQPLLDKKYDGYTGVEILKAIEAAYLECRYPVPNHFYREFPVPGLKEVYWDPVYSSGLHKFCYEFSRLILNDLKAKFGIGIQEFWWNQKITDDAGRRFWNLLFDSRKEDFLSKN